MSILSLSQRWKHVTFKKRIIFIFLFSSLIPFSCLGFISFYTIDSIISNKVESAIQSNLKQDLLTLENTLNNLNHVSQQLAYGERTNMMLEQMNNEKEPYRRIELLNEIKHELNVITFTNPNIGLMMYYNPDKDSYEFENFRVKGHFAPDKLPIIAQYSEITYYGPHQSYNGSINQFVFSTMRKVNLPDQDVYLYIETGRNAIQNVFAPQNRMQDSRRLLILDDTGRIAFSENEQDFPVNSPFQSYNLETSSGYYSHYFWCKATSNQGWSIVSILPEKDLNQERNQWLFQITGFSFVVLISRFFLCLAALEDGL